MAGGDVCKTTVSRVIEPLLKATRTDVGTFTQTECCFSLPALADSVNPDDGYRNDKHSVINKYDKNLFTFVIITLQKYEGSGYVDKVDLLDNTYGTTYNYGTFIDSDNTLKYVAYIIDWLKVLNAPGFGEGTYRFKFKETDAFANNTESFYPFEFCLKNYTEDRANFTTRFEWYTKGYRGDFENDTDVWDFVQVASDVGGDGWFNQMRLPRSFFGYNRSSYERDYIRYSNGQQVYLQDEQIEAYTWNSGQYPADLHSFIKNDVLQADRILVTDYNKNNPNIIKDKAIKPDSNYEPEWQYNNLKAFVNLDFVQEFQNRRKLRC